MSTIKPLESLQEVLQPIGNLQAENEEMAAWIHDSFAALEKLHEELTQWQSELVRKETELDLREDANRKLPPTDAELRERVLALDAQVTSLQTDLSLLEAENSDQVSAYEDLEQRYAELEGRFQDAQERIAELERELGQGDATQLKQAKKIASHEEAEELQSVLEDHIRLLTAQLSKLQAESDEDTPDENPPSAPGVLSKSAELRQRALSRRPSR